MGERILERIQRWRYLGHDRETVRRYRAETGLANLRIVRRLCVLAVGTIVLMFLFNGSVMRQPLGVTLFTSYALTLILLYGYITKRLKNIALEEVRHTRLLIYLVSASLYSCGIVAST